MQEKVERAAATLYRLHPAYETVAIEVGRTSAKITVMIPWERAPEWRRVRMRHLASEVLAAVDGAAT